MFKGEFVMKKVNEALRHFAYQTRKCRPTVAADMRTHCRIERVNGGYFGDFWFLTPGCCHDMRGGCVMCNYSASDREYGEAEEDRVISELNKTVRKFPQTFEEFLMTPSGSMLDEREVSPRMREQLLSVLEHVRAKRFIVETRADTVSEEGLRFLNRAVPGAEKYLEIGLESSNDWTLKHCLNKSSTFQEFCGALEMAHAYGIRVIANVGLGFPFMSERASVRQTIQTIRDALQANADSIVIFPYHVKYGTLLDTLYCAGLYQCVSLWALIDVIEAFPTEQNRLQISWYKDYYGNGLSYIRASPTTCPHCVDAVYMALDAYRDSPNTSVFSNLHKCPSQCRAQWERKLSLESAEIDIGEVERMYRQLALRIPIEQELLELSLSEMKRDYEALTHK